MDEPLPFRCEYAKSGRAKCTKCKEPIEKDVVRLAIMVRSPFFDGRVPKWHHYECFFQRHLPKGPSDIGQFENLKYEDQKRIEESISNGGISKTTVKGAGKKRKAEVVNNAVKDFSVEYAKSAKSKCKLCDASLAKQELRIGKMDYESEDAARFGPLNRWFHVDCFVTAREEVGFVWAAHVLANFDNIEKSDQKILKKKLPSIIKENKEIKVDSECFNQEQALKKQSDLLFNSIEELKKLKKNELLELYEYNSVSTIPKDTTKRIEYFADALVFGLPEKCPKCNDCLRFKISQYVCSGNVSEWEKCSYSTEEPKRTALLIPEHLKKYDFLQNYTYKPKKRIMNEKLKAGLQSRINKQMNELNVIKTEGDSSESNIVSSKLLSGYNVMVLGKISCKENIEQLGGKVTKSAHPSVLFIVSDDDTVKKTKSKQFTMAKDYKIPIVRFEVFDKLINCENIAQALIESKISLWEQSDEEINQRVNNLNIKQFKSGYPTKSKSAKNQSGKSKMIFKSGGVVDPDSELEHITHIYKEGESVYNAVLNKVDLAKNLNSYYKIQLLEDDRYNGRYYLFYAWGRIGTNIGNKKVMEYTTSGKLKNKTDAIEHFQNIFFEKTGNAWIDRKNFKKLPNHYFPIELDYDECTSKIDLSTTNSTLLPRPVVNLISLIFDTVKMKQTMAEFELDLEKMPLGKLSKNQLSNACATLKDISIIIDLETVELNKLTAACNKFYSMVPHNFGTLKPPLISTKEVIGKKMELLESLMDIELAYDIIRNATDDEDPFEFYYRKLDNIIEPLDRNGDEFKLIEKYMNNTHAETHSTYKLEIVEIFKINRKGEQERFKKHENNSNRMLLWHGSRTTNFVGILSQGLRIAPPEAPVCGYMFGKGVYFADSVSKSANYCNANSNSEDGLLILSEVALGKSYELTSANFITSLKKGFDSVKGLGMSHPNPKDVHILPDGVKVPMGKLIQNKKLKSSSLLYNEYIVYNVDQIKMRYLVNVKFCFNSLF